MSHSPRWALPIFVLLLATVVSPVASDAAQLTLTWTDAANDEDGFKIERDAGPTGTFVQIATVGASVTSYIDSGLASATTYCYRVRAFNFAGDSAYSNQACGTTPQTFGLAVVRAGTGSGTVTSTPAGITCGTSCAASYASGTGVTLTAAAASGSTFGGWSGGGCSGTGSCNVTLSAATTVTATLTSTSSTPSLQSVSWTNPINVTPTGNSIQKTSGCDGCEDAGSSSLQQILSGDGYLEFTASETTTLRFVGLSVGDTGTASAEIRFAIKLESGIAEVRESGTARTTTGFVSGDVFRIAVESGVVKYYKNGVLFYTSALAPAYPLLVDSALASLNASINTAVISGVLSTLTVVNDTTPPVISAVRAVNIGASAATITWTTNEAGDSQVEYGPTTAYGSSTARNTSLVTSHSQTLSGLAPSTLYHYRVKSRDAAGNLAVSPDSTFRTLDPPRSHKQKKNWVDAVVDWFKHLF